MQIYGSVSGTHMGGYACTLYDVICTLKFFRTAESCGIWETKSKIIDMLDFTFFI